MARAATTMIVDKRVPDSKLGHEDGIKLSIIQQEIKATDSGVQNIHHRNNRSTLHETKTYDDEFGSASQVNTIDNGPMACPLRSKGASAVAALTNELRTMHCTQTTILGPLTEFPVASEYMCSKLSVRAALLSSGTVATSAKPHVFLPYSK